MFIILLLLLIIIITVSSLNRLQGVENHTLKFWSQKILIKNLKSICDGVNFPPISMFKYNSGHFYLKAVDFKIRVLGPQ